MGGEGPLIDASQLSPGGECSVSAAQLEGLNSSVYPEWWRGTHYSASLASIGSYFDTKCSRLRLSIWSLFLHCSGWGQF